MWGGAGHSSETIFRIIVEGKPECVSYLPDGSVQPCLPVIEIAPGNDVQGHASGPIISISRGALRKLTDDELGLLVGHEISHWYLGHSGSNVSNELAADRMGARLACRAGFDLKRAAGLFRFLRSGSTHPRKHVRRALVEGIDCKN